jgi:hypothetical protein
MFFSLSSKPNSIILLSRDGVTTYPKEGSATMLFPESAVRFLEVLDKAKLAEVLTGFAQKLKNKRALVLIDKNSVFQKAVPLEKDTDVQAAKTDFERKVPFNAEDKHVVSFQQKNTLYLFGTNKALYMSVFDALGRQGIKVQAVVPAVVHGVTDAGKLTPTKCDQIYDASQLTHATDFLTN